METGVITATTCLCVLPSYKNKKIIRSPEAKPQSKEISKSTAFEGLNRQIKLSRNTRLTASEIPYLTPLQCV